LRKQDWAGMLTCRTYDYLLQRTRCRVQWIKELYTVKQAGCGATTVFVSRQFASYEY